MKKLILSLALAMGASALAAQDMTGTWSGTAELGAMRLRLVFHIGEDGGTMDSPDQGAMGIPLSRAAFARDTLRVEVAQLGLSYTGVLSDGGFRGAFTQRGVSFPLDLARGDAAPPRRPQEPHAPYPYRVEEVTFDNTEAGITLAGTLTLPRGEGPFPAVALVTGSGAQNRDEEILGHKPFLVLADHLTRRGVAVLRFDDRGVGGSGGDQRTATTADFASDALAALDRLRTLPEVDGRRVGLAGHSEGGMAAFIAAARNPGKVDFVVSMAGPGVKGEELLKAQHHDAMILQGVPEETAAEMTRRQFQALARVWGLAPETVEAGADSVAAAMVPGFAAMPDDAKDAVRRQIVSANSPWMRFFVEYDPAADLSRVVCPVLAVNGAKDVQVRASDNLAAIAAALREAGNACVETTEYPGLNHLFQTAATGAVAEYGTTEETFSPRVMDDIAAWILRLKAN